MQDVYLVKYTLGSDWIVGRHTREQPGYRAHVIGGPLADYSQVQLAIEASSPDEVRALLRDDPWQQKDMLRVEDITKWLLLVDPRMNRCT